MQGDSAGTATAISRRHVLTAAHLLDLDDNGSIDVDPSEVFFHLNLSSGSRPSHTITASALYVHPDWTGFQNPTYNDDVAIVELAEDLPDNVPIYPLSEESFEVEQVITLVGYGQSGNGIDGFTTQGSLTIKRTGQNVTDYFDADDEGSGAREIFYYDFDGPTEASNYGGGPTLGNNIETTIGSGDSGGPAFVDDGNGGYKIFGTNTFSFSFGLEAPDSPYFGSGGAGMVVAEYLNFIYSVIGGKTVTIQQTNGSTDVEENGTTDSYTIVLGEAPSSPVTIAIDGGTQLTVSPTEIVFTPDNWNAPRQVTVAAVDDSIRESLHRAYITHQAASDDPAYDAMRIPNVGVNISDDDWQLATTPYVDLGPSDNVAWDQPRVAVELIVDDGSENSVGPDLFNTWLLDTGANSIMAFANAVDNMDDPPYRYQTSGKFLEYGVAGDHIFDISASYRFDFAGTSGLRNTLHDTRILSDPDNDISPLGPWGIVGMPAMAGRVTTYDFTVWTDLDPTDLYMTVEFGEEVPSYAGPRYSVAVDNRISFSPDTQVISGNHTPVWAEVPFLTGIPAHNGMAAGGNFLYDSGAQLSVLSTRMARAIGLDSNNDGILDGNDANFTGHEVVGGIGGTIAAPVFYFDEFHVPTEQGVDLVWTDLQWLVLDIVEGLDGVLGFDLMTSGWIEAYTVDGKSGYFMQNQLDFRNMIPDENGHASGTIYLDVNPEVHQVIDPTGPGLTIIETGGHTTVSETGVRDSYFAVLTKAPTADVTVTLVHTENQLTAVDARNPTRGYLVFTPNNWDVPQEVRVTAIQDDLAESYHRSSVQHISSSADPTYDGVGMSRAIISIIDDEFPGLMAIPDDGATEVTEGGVGDTYEIVLTYPPMFDVRVYMENAPGQVIAVDANSPAGNNYLVFTASNWNVPQQVRVTAIDDTRVEGPHRTFVTHRFSTTDFLYSQDFVFALQEYVFISDNDVADFGDTPLPYPTSMARNGARHLPGGPSLGAEKDYEVDGQPTPSGDGDDADGAADDEDGVSFISPLLPGENAYVRVVASGTGRLNAWIDFNDDGDWVDTGEQIFQDVQLDAGQHDMVFPVPAWAVETPQTFARFRFSTLGGLTFTGEATGGEVEDHAVAIGTVAPQVESIVINSGSAQRSMIQSQTVTFGSLVTIEPGAFQLTRSDGVAGTVQMSVTHGDHATTAVLTFGGSVVGPGGSLRDGNYTLTILGSHVHDADGNTALTHVEEFFRMFGDRDGDRDVDVFDYAYFRRTFEKDHNSSAYNAIFDYENDGDVDVFDFAYFRRNFGKTLAP